MNVLAIDRSLTERACAWGIVLVAAVVLMLPFRGTVPSLAMAVMTGLGLTVACLATSPEDLRGTTRTLAVVVAGMAVWQVLGVAVRRPFDPRDLAALGSIAAIGGLFVMTLHVGTAARERVLAAVFVLGALSALVSIAEHVRPALSEPEPLRDILARRLVPFGRAQHPIIGAGGLAASFLAGLAILRHRRATLAAHLAALLYAGLAVTAVSVLMTQSRGPILALLGALAALWIVGWAAPERRPGFAVGLALACFAVPAALVVFEPALKEAFCHGADTGLCRPSMRQGVWLAVAEAIPARPLFGVGPSYRLPAEGITHAHNGVLGTVFFFGIPMGLLLVAAFGLALRAASRALPGAGRDFALAGLFFACSFLATDLVNPFAFLNTHALFLWLPLFVAVSLDAPALTRVRPAPETPAPTALQPAPR